MEEVLELADDGAICGGGASGVYARGHRAPAEEAQVEAVGTYVLAEVSGVRT